MNTVLTEFDCLAEDLAEIAETNGNTLTIALSPERGMNFSDFISLTQSMSYRHPGVILKAVSMYTPAFRLAQ